MVLEKDHINWYREDIQRAERMAIKEIEKAERQARESLCGSCGYCQNMLRHKKVLQRTIEGLVVIVRSLKEGMRASRVFPKIMYHDATLYRGFITDTGEYVPLCKTDHSEYRKEYAQRYGEERAYSMINIHGRGAKTRVLFCDRKKSPSEEQYAMLRELMIDAEGSLSFHFAYDTNHPK